MANWGHEVRRVVLLVEVEFDSKLPAGADVEVVAKLRWMANVGKSFGALRLLLGEAGG